NGEPVAALDLLRGVTSQGPVPRLVRVSAALLEADLWLALGEPERTPAALGDLDAADAAVAWARLQLAQGDPDGALATVAVFLADDREAVFPLARVEAKVLDAIARDALRDEPGALIALERALDMVEPRGCSIVVVRYG